MSALLTVAQAAALLGLTEKALRHRIARRSIPVKRLGLRTLRVDATELAVWMRESRRYAERRTA